MFIPLISLITIFLSTDQIRANEAENMADVIIAVDTRNQGMKDEWKEILKSIGKKLENSEISISAENVQIGVVQISDEIIELIKLQDGKANSVKNVDVEDTTRSGTMKNQDIAEAVREKMFTQGNRRSHVPDILIILTKYDLPPPPSPAPGHQDHGSTTSNQQRIEKWESDSYAYAESISFGMTADQVIVINNYTKEQKSNEFHGVTYVSSTSEKENITRQNKDQFHDAIAVDLIDKLKSLLEACKVERIPSADCHYNETGQCVVNVEMKPTTSEISKKQSKYYPRDHQLACLAGLEGCRKECRKFETWSECHSKNCSGGYRLRIMKEIGGGISKEKMRQIFERCSKFDNHTRAVEWCESAGCPDVSPTTMRVIDTETTTVQEVGVWTCGVGTGFVAFMRACTPVWFVIVLSFIHLVITAVAVFVQKRIYHRRLRMADNLTNKLRSLDSTATERGNSRTKTGSVNEFEPNSWSRSGSKMDSVIHGVDKSQVSKSTKPTAMDSRSRSADPNSMSKVSTEKETTLQRKQNSKAVLSESKKSKFDLVSVGGSGTDWAVDKPPSVTGRTIDELYQMEKKKEAKTEQMECPIEKKKNGFAKIDHEETYEKRGQLEEWRISSLKIW